MRAMRILLYDGDEKWVRTTLERGLLDGTTDFGVPGKPNQIGATTVLYPDAADGDRAVALLHVINALKHLPVRYASQDAVERSTGGGYFTKDGPNAAAS